MDRIAALFNELGQLRLDVIVSSEGALIRAAKKATTTIPVVMVINGDPVADGYVDSLARPGGNITGLTRLNRELSGKRIELLKEVIPKISKIGILFAATSRSLANSFKEYQSAARAQKMPLQSLGVDAPNPELEPVLRGAVKQGVSAIITVRGSVLNRHSKKSPSY